MIRLATLDDLPELVRMSIAFNAVSPYKDIPVEEEKIAYFLSKLLTGDPHDSIVIVAVDGDRPVGMVAGLTAEFMWNTQRHASELVWWVDPGFRKGSRGHDLKSAFEYWAKNIANAKFNHMASLDDRVGRLYIKNGYKKVEMSFMKELL